MTDYQSLLDELKLYRRIRVDQLDANMTDEEAITGLAALQGAITAVEAVMAEAKASPPLQPMAFGVDGYPL